MRDKERTHAVWEILLQSLICICPFGFFFLSQENKADETENERLAGCCLPIMSQVVMYFQDELPDSTCFKAKG